MAFEDAISALTALDGKQSGELIRAEEDWNTLVRQVIEMGNTLNTKLDTLTEGLRSDVDDILQRLGTLEDEVQALTAHVGLPGNTDTATLTGKVAALEDLPDELLPLQPLLQDRRVTMQTQSDSYLIGEAAEITATVSTLDGEPVTDRPWVDFVCTWGTVIAASGFLARPGSSGQAVSVRTDSNGVAKVQVRAQQAVRLTNTDELQVNALFQTVLPNPGETFREAVFLSSSTTGSLARAAYQEMSRTYETTGMDSIRLLADNYYTGGSLGNFWDRWPGGGTWHDYRSTVLAFVKPDSDPTTADFSLGSSSMQIRFRDWIGPWIAEYIGDDSLVVEKLEDSFDDALLNEDKLVAIDKFKLDFEAEIGGGVVERAKFLGAAGKAADAINIAGLPAYAGELTQQVKIAAQTQQAVDVLQFAAQAGGPGGADQPLFGAFMGQATGAATLDKTITQSVGTLRSELETLDGEVGNRVGAVEQELQGVTGNVTGLDNQLVVLNSRMDSSESAGNTIQSSLTNIENQVTGINVLDADSVTGRLAEITAEIGLIRANVIQP